MAAKLFEVQINWSIDSSCLAWPMGEDRQSDTLGGNREYLELGRIGWRTVSELIRQEGDLITKISRSGDAEVAHEEWLEETCDDPEAALLGMDLGTNALVAALKASRCLPFYSCNAGAFGGRHNDTHPVVAFFCRSQMAELIVRAAKTANAGLENNHSGGLTVYGGSVIALLEMASALYSIRADIAKVRLRAKRTSHFHKTQGELF